MIASAANGLDEIGSGEKMERKKPWSISPVIRRLAWTSPAFREAHPGKSPGSEGFSGSYHGGECKCSLFTMYAMRALGSPPISKNSSFPSKSSPSFP